MANELSFSDFSSEFVSDITDTKEREVAIQLVNKLDKPFTSYVTRRVADAVDVALADAGLRGRRVTAHEKSYRNMLTAWKNNGHYPGAPKKVSYIDCAQADIKRMKDLEAGKSSKDDFTFSDGTFMWDNPYLIPKVISDFVREPAEIIPTMTPLMTKIRFDGPHTSVAFPVVSSAAFGPLDLAEGDPYPEATMEFGAQVMATMGKVGVMVKFTDEAIKYNNFDVMGLHLRAAGTALVRWKEQKCADHITEQGETYFDNAEAVSATNRHTTGRGSDFLFNGTFSLQDLLAMYGDMLNDGFIPNTLLMNPMAWTIFAQDPTMRAWAYAQGGMVWQKHQGEVGSMRSWLVGEGRVGTTEPADPKQLQTTWSPVPGIFPYPLRIVVSPFIPFDSSTSTTTIILCDSSELGILAVNEEISTEEWRDPMRDINNVKLKERYAIQILNNGRSVRQAKNVIIARSYDLDDKLALQITGAIPTGESFSL